MSAKPVKSPESAARHNAWLRLSENPDFRDHFLTEYLDTRIAQKRDDIAEKMPFEQIPAARAAIKELRDMKAEVMSRFRQAKTST